MSAFPLLARRCGHEMFARLIAMLPPLREDTLEAMLERDTTALAAVAALGRIETVEEASLAITIVAADCHAHDALRSAGESQGNLKLVMQCRAQAMAMLRTRRQAAERLERLQAMQEPLPEPHPLPHPDLGARHQAEQVPAPPRVPARPRWANLTREERIRRRDAAVADLARIAGRTVPTSPNRPADHVSLATPNPTAPSPTAPSPTTPNPVTASSVTPDPATPDPATTGPAAMRPIAMRAAVIDPAAIDRVVPDPAILASVQRPHPWLMPAR